MKKTPMQRQQGVTLIELLVATTLSILLLGGVIQVFSHNQRMSVYQQGVSSVQTNGRFALGLLSFHFRLAGYTSNPEGRLDAIVAGCNDADCADDIIGDSVSIVYEPGNARDMGLDCVGGAINPGAFVRNTYFVQVNDAGVSALMCAGRDENMAESAAPPALELVQNVERMEVLYGVDVDPDDNIAIQYVGFDRLLFNREHVVSVQIALLMTSPGLIRTSPETAIIPILDKELEPNVNDEQVNYPANDRRLRKVFSTTIVLRNERAPGVIPSAS